MGDFERRHRGRPRSRGADQASSLPAELVAAIRNEVSQFHPTVARLNADADAAARAEARVANRAGARAVTAFVASLVVGIVALVLLGWRHQRLRRRAALAAQRLTIEGRSDRRIRALLEHSTDALTVIGPDLHVRWTASSVKRMLGLDPSLLFGRPITETIDFDDADRAERFLTAAAQLPGIRRLAASIRLFGNLLPRLTR